MRLFNGMISTPSTSAASRASCSDKNTLLIPYSRATTTMGEIPFVCLNPPSRDNSPRNIADSGGELAPGIADVRTNLLSCLLYRRVGQSDDDECRKSGGDVRLDLDDVAIETDHRTCL